MNGSRSVRLDGIVSIFAIAASSLLQVVALGIIGDHGRNPQVGALLSTRLIGSVVLGISSLGLPVVLQRVVASAGDVDRRAWILAGGRLSLVSILVIHGILAVWSATYVNGLLGVSGSVLWQSQLFYAGVQGLATLVVSVAFAVGRAGVGGAVNFIVYGFSFFVAAACVDPRAVDQINWLAGAVALPVPLAVIAVWLHRQGGVAGDTRGKCSTLVRQGWPRATMSGAEYLLDAVIPLALGHFQYPLHVIGSIVVLVTVVRLSGPISAAVSQVLIPYTARTMAEEGGNLPSVSRRALTHVLDGACVIAVVVIPWRDSLSSTLYGVATDGMGVSGLIIACSAVPVFVFGAMRGVVEGGAERPLNALNLWVCAGLMGLGVFGLAAGRASVPTLASYYLLVRIGLATATVYASRALEPGWSSWQAFAPPLVVGVVLCSVTALVQAYFLSGSRWVPLLGMLVGVSLALGAIRVIRLFTGDGKGAAKGE